MFWKPVRCLTHQISLLGLCRSHSTVSIATKNFIRPAFGFSRPVIRFSTPFNRSFSVSHGCLSRGKLNSDTKKKSTVYYVVALGVLTVGFSYAAVPLYRLFCQAYSYGGTMSAKHDSTGLEDIKADRNRVLTIRFNADTSSTLTWNFKPQQRELKASQIFTHCV